jgi:hypothetical protein
MDGLSVEQLFGEEAKQYQSPEKLQFLLDDYPGYKIKGGIIAEIKESAYILSILTLEGYEVDGMAGPDEIFSLKFCTVRPSDMKKCDCSGFIGVADVFAKIIGDIEMPEGVEVGDLVNLNQKP